MTMKKHDADRPHDTDPHDTDPHDDHRATDHRAATRPGHNRRVGRREVLLGGAALGTGLLAGCSGGSETTDEAPPDPVSLGDTETCDVCGMVISEHPGPNGQIFYREAEPSSGGNPVRFDSPKACLFPYYFEHDRRGWTAEVVYVTDYSRVDYEITAVDGRRYIGTATAPSTFADARDTVFVVGSEVDGAMGPDFVPFSEASDAATFVDEFGGRTVARDDVTPSLLGR